MVTMWKAGRRIASLHDARPNQNVQNQGNVYSSHCRNNRISGHEWFASRPAFPVYLRMIQDGTKNTWKMSIQRCSPPLVQRGEELFSSIALALYKYKIRQMLLQCEKCLYQRLESYFPNVCIWKIRGPKINSMIVFAKLTISRVPKFRS